MEARLQKAFAHLGVPAAESLHRRDDAGARELLRTADAIFVGGGVTTPGVFYVRIRATNGAGISDPSNEVVVRVGQRPSGVPKRPQRYDGRAGGVYE